MQHLLKPLQQLQETDDTIGGVTGQAAIAAALGLYAAGSQERRQM